MYNAVGGTTIHWAACWARFLPSDFRVRSLDGVADDWPFTYEDLEPYYEKVEGEFAVSGLGGDPAYPPSSDPPLPPLPINEAGRKAAQALNSLGWHWWPGMQAIPSEDYGTLKQCARLATCRTGCPVGAKASTDITHWPAALGHGARLITRARVREITIDKKGRATGAVYVDPDGVEHHQEADVVIVTANGIGTPRLLLLSESGRFPEGLANSSGLVGKRLMMHPVTNVTGVYEDTFESWVGPNGEWMRSLQFYETDESRGFVRGAKWLLMPTHGPLSMLARFQDGELFGSLEDRQNGPFERLWGVNHHRLINESNAHSMEWVIVSEDLPEESNCVTLSDDLTDSNGIPSPKVNYRVSENTRRLVEFHVARAQDAHEAAGAAGTIVLRWHPPGHLMGTARMGNDPATAVVNQYGRTHDVPNLYVFDGSVLVTSSGVNPTATIAAVARRCVENLVADASNQDVPA